MNILFSTGSIHHLPLEDIFTLVKIAGFDGCDLVLGREFDDPRHTERVLKCLEIAPVCSIHAPYAHVAAFGDDIEAIRRSIELAKIYKTEVVTFHPPSWLAKQFTFLRWFRNVKDFQQELACNGVALALENMPLKRVIFPAYLLTDYRSLVRFGMERNLFFTYDITHLGSCGQDPMEALLLYMKTGRLKNVHISDYSPGQSKSHLGMGRGDLPIPRILNTLRKLGYDGCVTLELAPRELPRTREWLLDVLTYACSYLKLQLGQGTLP